MEHLTQQGVAWRLELVLGDRGVTAAAARDPVGSMTSRSVGSGWDDKQTVFRPIRHAWRVEVAHGRLHRHDMVHLSRERARRLPVDVAA